MTITNVGESVVFGSANAQFIFPKKSIELIAQDGIDTIVLRVLASRKNVLNFNYNDVENISSSSATDLIAKLVENNII